jgi:hypothetical protein
MRFRLFFLCPFLMLLQVIGHAQTDTTAAKKSRPKEDYGRQLRISFDISKPVVNLMQDTRNSYEAAVDYYLRKEVYAVVEGGFGNARYEYPDLSYRSANAFFRIVIDKTLIKRLNGNDWDAAFIGIRYGAAFIDRQEASYAIVDSLWGASAGVIPAKAFTAHWAEITGGVRVELLRNIMAGWNVRGRFLLNDKAFGELSPVFIAGYGKGDKTTVFDFSFYICYTLRWRGAR